MTISKLRTLTSAVAFFVVGLSLVGCSAGVETAEVPDDVVISAGSDRTEEMRSGNPGAAWLDSLIQADETEPGRVLVSTTIVDPRGDEGTVEAQSAIAVCEAAVALLGDSAVAVTVYEEDGTTFVLFGHPSVPDGECGEV